MDRSTSTAESDSVECILANDEPTIDHVRTILDLSVSKSHLILYILLSLGGQYRMQPAYRLHLISTPCAIKNVPPDIRS